MRTDKGEIGYYRGVNWCVVCVYIHPLWRFFSKGLSYLMLSYR